MSGQPVGHLCDLLGVSRFWPEVFDAMIDLLTEGKGGREDFEGGRTGRLAALAQRMRGKRR